MTNIHPLCKFFHPIIQKPLRPPERCSKKTLIKKGYSMRIPLIFFCFFTLINVNKGIATTTLITTSTGDIGRACVNHYAGQGDHLILVARNSEGLSAQIQKLQHHFPQQKFDGIVVDFSKKEDIENIASQLKNIPIDRAIVLTPRPDLKDSLLPDARLWEETLRTTFIGPLEVLKRALPALKESKGRIVVVSGITAKEVMPAYGAFGVIRSMWMAETKALSHILAKDGVLINTVAPGVVLTEKRRQKLIEKATEHKTSIEEETTQEVENTPLSRHASLEDVIYAIDFYINSKNKHMTGSLLTVDGGYTKAY